MNRAERIFRLHRCLKSRQPPSLARLMDELPGRPRIGEDGQLGSPDQWGYVVLVLPVLMVWSHLLYFVFWMLS